MWEKRYPTKFPAKQALTIYMLTNYNRGRWIKSRVVNEILREKAMIILQTEEGVPWGACYRKFDSGLVYFGYLDSSLNMNGVIHIR